MGGRFRHELDHWWAMLHKSIQLLVVLAISLAIGILVNSWPQKAEFRQALRLLTLILASGVLVAVLMLHRNMRRRARRFLLGCCPDCGYDLRGSPRRCTECGQDPPDDSTAIKLIALAYREPVEVHAIASYLLAVVLMLHPSLSPGIAKLAGYGYRAWVLISYAGRFDASQWRRFPPVADEISVRVGMVDDLVENHLPVGMSREEIEQMLGPFEASADKPESFRHPIRVDSSLWGTFTEYLVLEFDQEGKLIRARRD